MEAWRAALTLLLALASAHAAAAECYAVDAAHGSVSFSVQQAGAPFHGKFRRFGGSVCLEGEAVTGIDVWLEPASVDSGLPELDAALKGKDFFDTDRHARVTFKSDSVQARGGAEVANGTLEMKGVRRDVSIPFRLSRAGGAPLVSGSFGLNRLDYAIGTGEWANTKWLGATVSVEFRAPLTKP
jgi:polyisoprenoid-binding protein YceI